MKAKTKKLMMRIIAIVLALLFVATGAWAAITYIFGA